MLGTGWDVGPLWRPLKGAAEKRGGKELFLHTRFTTCFNEANMQLAKLDLQAMKMGKKKPLKFKRKLKTKNYGMFFIKAKLCLQNVPTYRRGGFECLLTWIGV